MAEPFVGQIMLFAGSFAPYGWALCDGQTLPISQYTALFSLLGTFYGGDGVTTFALPDLRGRVAISFGQGSGLSNYVEGETGGFEAVTLTTQQIPQHTHQQPATAADQTTNRPQNAVPSRGGFYAATSDGTLLQQTTAAGNSQPHENRQPYLVLNYCIALAGIYPSRN